MTRPGLFLGLLLCFSSLLLSGSASEPHRQTHHTGSSMPTAEQPASLLQSIQQAYRDWDLYKGLHSSKNYSSQTGEETTHMLAFLQSRRMAREHNEAYARGEVSFELDAWNALADLPFDEYMRRNGYRHRQRSPSSVNSSSRFLSPMNVGRDVPESIDWRDHGYVTEVKDQEDCGSCWAFSATGSLEGQHKRATGTLVSLSEQNLVDCSDPYGARGCRGGWVDSAFEYIKANKGIDIESHYAYHAFQQTCMYSQEDRGATLTGIVDLKARDEAQLKVAVGTQGPVSVIIDAAHKSFALYKAGVYEDKDCNPGALNHAVLVVGYGTDPAHGDYWLVKNSWGPGYGEQGYIRIARNKHNMCGIASRASYPLV